MLYPCLLRGYYFQPYALSWISFKRSFSQSASVSVARHNGSYTGGPFKCSTLLICVGTDVRLGKRNDFLEGFQISPPCPSKSSKEMKMSVQHWRNDNQINSEKSLSLCHLTRHKSRTDCSGIQHRLTASVRVHTTSVITSQGIIGIFSEYLFCGAVAQGGPWLPRFWAVKIIHKQRRTTVGWTPLVEWSARRRDLYLTTHNTHNRRTSMPPVGFEPRISASERPQTYDLDRAATGTGNYISCSSLNVRHEVSQKSCISVICAFYIIYQFLLLVWWTFFFS